MSTPAKLPPFRVIEAALRVTTERLTREIATPRPSAPDWNDFEWAVARATSSMHGISGLLATRLAWRGPPAWLRFLETQHEFIRQQHEEVGRVLARADRSFRASGIAFVALKGSALRALEIYRPGERPQADIDLLVEPDQLRACEGPLREIGYHRTLSTARHDVYTPTSAGAPTDVGEHPDNPLKIEVHSRISEALPLTETDITSTLLPATRRPGANPYANLAALMRHTGLHAAGNMRANAMRFMQIVEVAWLARRMTSRDWQELLEGTSRHAPWWLFPALALAARYVPGSVPEPVLTEAGRTCPRRLRQRYSAVGVYDVSWSNPRIAALPGHEWSRTPAETWRYLQSRALPSRERRDQLVAGARSVNPHLLRIPWYGRSHAERILRWIFSRPPRVQTLSVVSAALREAGP